MKINASGDYDLATYLSKTLAGLDIDKACVFFAWQPNKDLIGRFLSIRHLTLALSISQPLGSQACVVFCGAETAIGFRRLFGWHRQGVKTLMVLAAPGFYQLQPLSWWLRRAAVQAVWRRLTPWAEQAWAFGYRSKLKKIIALARAKPVQSRASNIDLLAIESLGRGGAEKQILLRADDLAKAGHLVTILINDTRQSRVAQPSTTYQLKIQKSLEEIFELGETLGGSDDNKNHDSDDQDLLCGVWRELQSVLPADLWQGTYLAALALKGVAPKNVVTYLDWTNTTVGLAAVLCGTPCVRMSFRNIAPKHFAFHRAEFKAVYQAMIHTAGVRFEANSYAGQRSYARWLGVPTSSIAYQPNYEAVVATQKVSSLPPRAGLIGWLGRFASEKDPDLWLATTAALCRDFPSAAGVMAGGGPLLASINSQIDSRGLADRVLLRVVTAKPEDFLSGLDLLLVSSRYEGTPNVIAEAAQVGTAVVSTDAGDSSLMARTLPGVTVVKTRDPEVLAQQITNIGVA